MIDDFIHQNQPQFDRICQKMQVLLTRKQKLAADEPKQIVDRIYLGNYSYAIDKQYIQQQGISLVVSCLKIQQRDRLPGVQYQFVLVSDKPDENISQHFDNFCKLVNSHLQADGKHKCLVNCFFAKSRSPTLIASYLIKQKGMSVSEALNQIKDKSAKVDPNKGFVAQLQQYSKIQIKIKTDEANKLKGETANEEKIQQLNNHESIAVEKQAELKQQKTDQIQKDEIPDKISEDNINKQVKIIQEQSNKQTQIKSEQQNKPTQTAQQQKVNELTLTQHQNKAQISQQITTVQQIKIQPVQTAEPTMTAQVQTQQQQPFQNLQKGPTQNSQKKEEPQVMINQVAEKQHKEQKEEEVGHEEGEIRKKKKKHKKKK